MGLSLKLNNKTDPHKVTQTIKQIELNFFKMKSHLLLDLLLLLYVFTFIIWLGKLWDFILLP